MLFYFILVIAETHSWYQFLYQNIIGSTEIQTLWLNAMFLTKCPMGDVPGSSLMMCHLQHLALGVLWEGQSKKDRLMGGFKWVRPLCGRHFNLHFLSRLLTWTHLDRRAPEMQSSCEPRRKMKWSGDTQLCHSGGQNEQLRSGLGDSKPWLFM